MANKNAAKYTISFLTLGYILHSSIPLTNKMDENFHYLDKEVSIVNSEIYEPQSKSDDDLDSIIEKTKTIVAEQKKQTEKNVDVNEIIKQIKVRPSFESKKQELESPSIKIKTQKKKLNKDSKSTGVVLMGYATAYTASSSARMANGKKPIEGVHCAMNKKYKGQRVKVTIGNDVRYYDVDDTGPLKNGVIIDIYMNDRQQCLNFGKRKAKVEFVTRYRI